MTTHSAPRARFNGFTLMEVLVVIGVIAVLVAVLLPALTGAKRSADLAKSKSNMRQIATWMTMYSSENREYILPSQFNYQSSQQSGYPVKVRSHSDLSGTNWGNLQYRGTWTDILWVYGGLGSANAFTTAVSNDTTRYQFDSPDRDVYEHNPNYDENPLRSAAPNSKDFQISGSLGNGPKPYGTGATESGLPGFFAANNFFNTDPTSSLPAKWYTIGEIRQPNRSLYLIDSFAGETIDPEEGPYDNRDTGPGTRTIEVDFRYTGACLIMFLDGSSETYTAWSDIRDLEGCVGAGGEVNTGRRIRIRDLTARTPTLLNCP